jgi:TP901 family phage tail tape measure protein
VTRSVSVKLLADVANYVGNVGGKAVTATKSLTGELDKASKAGKLDGVTRTAAGLGLGLVGLAAGAVKMSMDFEKSMSAVSAATHASTGEIGQLRAAALQAGKDTSFSATQAADGITELSKAGVSTADVLGGGLRGALDLAAAGQLDVGEAAETAASAMTQFKLSGTAVPHIADLLAAAAGKAQGSVHDMGAALNQAGLVSAQMGLSLEDTTGTLAAFASAGLIGSDAGTSLKTAMLMLANPTGKAKDLMKDLGIETYDAQGKFVGITKLAGNLKDRLSGLTQEQRNSALATIFGSDAIRAASILYDQGADGIQKWIDKTNDSGYAAETAKLQTDNLAGDIERLKGSLETLAIQAGTGANAGLRKLAQGANTAVDAFADLPGWVQQSITVLSGVGGASLLAGAGFLKARGTAKDLMDELRDMGPRGAAAATGLGKVASIAGKLGLAGAAAVGLYEGFKLFGDWIDHFSAPVARDVDKMTVALQEFASTGKVTGELAKTFGSDLSGLQKQFEQMARLQEQVKKLSAYSQTVFAGRGAGAAPNAADLAAAEKQLAQLRENTAALDQTLTQMASNGGAAQARIAFQRLAAATGVNIDQLPQYKAAAAAAAAANTGLAKGFGDTAANARTMTGQLEAAIEAGQTLTDVWNQLNGAILNTDKANLAAAQAIDDVKKSFKENKKAIDGNSEAALRNRIAVGEAAKGAAAAAQAKYEETGSVKEASKTYNSYVGQLRKTLMQQLGNKTSVDKLLAAYAKMPNSVTTKVGITGDANVGKRLNRLAELQAALKAGKNISTANAMSKKGFGYHDGGRTAMVGEYEPAGVVHGKEFVFNANTVRKIDRQAPGFLDEVHATGSIPGYARGGRVSWPFPVTAAKTRIPPWSEVAAAVTPDFGNWPSSPGAQRGDSGVWRKIVALVNASGIPHTFGNAYRPGDPKWHGSGRAVDFMGYNQDRLAQFFMARESSVLELIHRSSKRDYGVTRGHYNAMPTQWPLHRNHLHVAMANGGVIDEPVYGIGASGRSYSFGERGAETVTPGVGGGGGNTTTINLTVTAPVGSHPREIGATVVNAIGAYIQGGGELRVRGQKVF